MRTVLPLLVVCGALAAPLAAANEAPVAADDDYTTPWSENLSVDEPGVLDNDTDPDGDPLTAVLVGSAGATGTLFLYDDGSLEYEPVPGFVGVDSFTYVASDGVLSSAPATVAFTVTNAGGGGGPVAYTSESAYLTALANLGYTGVLESFEDDGAWGVARTPVTATSVTSQDVTWTANNGTSGITTGTGPPHSGTWGFFCLPHGNYSSAPACSIPGMCTDGWRGSSERVMVAVGGWLHSANSGGKVKIILDDDAAENISGNETFMTAPWSFLGVIDPTGFQAFEFREIEGVSEDAFYIFGDDFTLAFAPEPWIDLGGGTPGVAGVPTATGRGPLLAGWPLGLALADGPPSSPMLLWISNAPTPFAALGGTVQALPYNVELLLFTDAGGAFDAAGTFPSGVPGGTEFTFQFVLRDVTSVYGLTLSNGTRATAP